METVVSNDGIAHNDKDIEIDGSNGTANTNGTGKGIEICGNNGTIANTGNEDEICSDASKNKEILSSTRVVRHRRKGIPRRAPFF